MTPRVIAPTQAAIEPTEAPPTATPSATAPPATSAVPVATPIPPAATITAGPQSTLPPTAVSSGGPASPTPFPTLSVATPSARVQGATLPITINIDSTYPRNGPDWSAGPVGRMLKWSSYTAIARDSTASWVLVQDGSSRVWLHGSMFKVVGELTVLPVNAQGFSPGVLPLSRVAGGLPAIPDRAYGLFSQAVAAGRDGGMVTVIGDCNSEWQVYFGRYANGGYSLSASGAGGLAGVSARFAKSFYRASLATHGSFNAAAALDPTWSDPGQCKGGESPLECEIRVSNASIVIIALGTGDTFTWQGFEGSLRAILDRAIAARTLPILMTKADDLESQQGGAPPGFINNVIRAVGAQYGVPVIDLWQATRGLTDRGLAPEVREDAARGIIDLGAQRFHLNDDGMNARIVLTLQTLSAIAR